MSIPDELKFLLKDGLDERELNYLEMFGSLVLLAHWQRGAMAMLFEMCKRNGLLSETYQQNWSRIEQNLALYEERIWELAPSRALTAALKHYRETGEVLADIERLTETDDLGRLLPHLADMEPVLESVTDRRQDAGYFGHAYTLLKGDDND